MPRLEERDSTYFTTVRGMCRGCRKVVPARVFFRDGGVWQESLCPQCGGRPALVAGDQEWYLENVLRPMPDHAPLQGAHQSAQGCPQDCGPCAWHASPCRLPVIPVTNVCNLECPICLVYNRADRPCFLSEDELRRTLDALIAAAGPLPIVNLTGGEPTLHPRLPELLECCRRPEIGRVTVNSNGLRLAEDFALCERQAALEAHVVLSFNTFDPQVSLRLHGRDVVGAKLRAVENLTRAGARFSLLQVMVQGENQAEAGRLLETMRGSEAVLSLAIQTMTYTGPGGGRFGGALRRHIPADEAARIVCAGSDGALEPSDFMPHPAAHPLCYSVCWMLRAGGKLVPLTRLAPRERVAALLGSSYLPDAEALGGFLREALDGLYARDERAGLAALRELVGRLHPPGRSLAPAERRRVAESAVCSIYIHAYMDEDTFDCSRAMLCPDLTPVAPGRLVPICTYNLFHRRGDGRLHGQA